VPTWVLALQLSEVWGVPPWQVMDAPGGLMWAARYSFYRKQQNVVAEWIRERDKPK
jgi:hypothetical protein